MAYLSPYIPGYPSPVMSHQEWEREVLHLQHLHLREEEAKEKLAREAAPPPPRVPRTMDEAYAWLLRGRDVEATLRESLMRKEDAEKKEEARRRREAEWPIGDWGCSYMGEDRVKTVTESLGE